MQGQKKKDEAWGTVTKYEVEKRQERVNCEPDIILNQQ